MDQDESMCSASASFRQGVLEFDISDVLRESLGTAPFVPRRKCFDEFEEMVARRVSFVYAPTGFGKTTALAAWAAKRLEGPEPWRFAWVALGESARDSSCVLDKVKSALVRAASQPGETFLLVDGFERVDELEVGVDLVSFGLSLPTSMHIVFISSREPPFAELGVAPFFNCHAVNADSLALTQKDIEQVYDELGVPGAQRLTGTIVDDFGGWPFRFFCELIAIQNPAARSRVSLAVEASLNLLLRSVPPDDRAFLERTAMLDRLNAQLCDFALNANGAESSIEGLRRSGLLQDDGHGWWRLYEPLRRHVLRTAAPLDPAAHEIALRSHVWLARYGHREESARQLLLSGNLSDPLSITCSILPEGVRLDSELDVERKVLVAPLGTFESAPFSLTGLMPPSSGSLPYAFSRIPQG